jgi:2-oxo-3-hexenedioate decarboxylase
MNAKYQEQSENRRATDLLAALDARRQLAPFTTRDPGFDVSAAYRTAAELRRLRLSRGERRVGRKLGFTNRTIWDEYGVHQAIWGDMYDTTLADAAPGENAIDIAALSEPRIEPEIAFGIARTPQPGMDEAQILGCIAWAAHGIEIVQSIFPGWKFKAADTVAQNALHGRYLLGPRVPVDPSWLGPLASFEIVLSKEGTEVDRGHARNVLDGPLSALKHAAALMKDDPLQPGEIVTTGVVTRAFPVAVGERWSTRIEGLSLEGLSVRFS